MPNVMPSVTMLHAVMLSIIELNVIMQNAVMLSIVRPSKSCSDCNDIPLKLSFIWSI